MSTGIEALRQMRKKASVIIKVAFCFYKTKLDLMQSALTHENCNKPANLQFLLYCSRCPDVISNEGQDYRDENIVYVD